MRALQITNDSSKISLRLWEQVYYLLIRTQSEEGHISLASLRWAVLCTAEADLEAIDQNNEFYIKRTKIVFTGPELI